MGVRNEHDAINIVDISALRVKRQPAIHRFKKLNMSELSDSHTHFDINLTNCLFFSHLEVVNRNSETQF